MVYIYREWIDIQLLVMSLKNGQGIPRRRKSSEGAHLQHDLLNLRPRGSTTKGSVDVNSKLFRSAENRQGRDRDTADES